MTDNEIIKALECCASKMNLCGECPVDGRLKDNCECGMHLASECLSLVNRQKAEIERLENLHSLAVAEREANVKGFAETIAKTKTEAIKEFAESIKLEFYREFDEIIPSIMADKIDNLVKIAEGENERV